MRLFTALLPPDHVLDASGQLADKVAELRAMDRAGQLRWTHRANWHITLAFYGEVGEGQLDGLRERLSRAARRGRPLRLRIAGGGHFGHRSLWAAVTGAPSDADGAHPGAAENAGHRPDGEGVRRLAATTAAAGRRIGLGTDEPHRFRAHLTLARSRSQPFDLRPYTAALDEFAGEPWTAGELALVRSNLPDSGEPGDQPRYEQIAAWPLGG
ncbi:RNA 2',3'-cyclic phosphodiesterase [Streptomyces bathyalis]|uniref:RNA 2',3'-cyclic phosphodiesterase n=1 Tax=Streptomyces bathyalis TaxID=2710756 RepID=A0A7T1WTI7_9ACTN|nr:2'-5' RNA ligase family protein [Streptomyces bathyalis]QPP08217.1 RNA 2',3'-cyclic phosphodiesterase [Streptomyces bathyalis]